MTDEEEVVIRADGVLKNCAWFRIAELAKTVFDIVLSVGSTIIEFTVSFLVSADKNQLTFQVFLFQSLSYGTYF